MSPAANSAAVPRTAVPEPAPERRPRRRLQPVEAPAPRRRPRLAYAVVALAGAVAIAVAQMSLSILITQTSYDIAALNQERRAATLQAQELQDEVAGLSSPQYLAANAAALGMVIDASPSFLRLSDGAVIGAGHAAGADSTVDVAGRAAVGNALIGDTPLVTDPATTLDGPVVQETEAGDETAPAADDPLPPPLTEGLPRPQTR
ncbi:hypothetical protein [Microbacterium album]|uniref:Cell division protein FtsL n=1 Tax=Microbacterium album TaxID=2053191 RepID=A0A917IG43_9MICO|nr:hypothetical protein [Microbacterium album]GGH40415.1 hypothetical protein GCM10010921_12350 [Microbacterium album]